MKPDNTAFQVAFNKLNPEQKEAVTNIEGPVMVVAGPGTGKTQILTLRIANILLQQPGIKPGNILALTFTESGARAMRDRLRQYIGALAYEVPIYTFHGFANTLISTHPEAYERIIGGRPVTDLERVKIITTVLDSTDFKKLRPAGKPDMYVGTLLKTISDLKKEYISPSDLSEFIDGQVAELSSVPQYHEKGAHKGKVRKDYLDFEADIQKNQELQAVYVQYETMLKNDSLYDFEDMIIETVKALSNNENLRLDVQETYQYVLADEHQDVNGAQNKILELITDFHEQPNIFVVGDEKQAIYRFQGASLHNFLYFGTKYKDTKIIQLKQNYRSGQEILDASHTLVQVPDDSDLAHLRTKLSAFTPEVSKVSLASFSYEYQEIEAVTASIKEKIDNGVSPEELAVIVRTNSEVEMYATELRKRGIKVVASADTDIFNHPVMRAVEHLIEATISPRDEVLFALLHDAYWGIGLPDLVTLSKQVRNKKTLISLLEESALQSLGIKAIPAISKIPVILETARQMLVTDSPLRALEYLIKESGLLKEVSVLDPYLGTSVLRRLYDEVANMLVDGSAKDFMAIKNNLAERRRHNLPLSVPYLNQDRSGVHVMTAHKSKGLEFFGVYIPNASDARWSSKKSRQIFALEGLVMGTSETANDDELRLLYVAMTRAKRELTITYHQQSQNGKEQLPSRLLTPVTETIEVVAETGTDDMLGNLADAIAKPALSNEFILEALKERGLSVTALNNYLENPWNYIYRNVVRVPEVQALPMMFGSVVHAVMQMATGRYAETGSLPTDTEIISVVSKQLGRLPLSDVEYTVLHERAITALLSYVKETVSTWPKSMMSEKTISVQLQTGLSEFPELTLTGNLDRLDFATDGTLLQVIDYKTGQPKSRNEIEGKTKDANGNYKRQLVFYALLLSLSGDPGLSECRRGTLSFVEPNKSGKFKEESFLISNEEIEELKVSIINFLQEIITGEILSNRELAEVSDYAEFAKRWVR